MSQQAMRVFSTEFKVGVVLRLDGGERLAAVAGIRDYGITGITVRLYLTPVVATTLT
jgi:hypothetical protein